ncbi:DUF4349 domain-containing protein [Couchioplanes caeruleus]|uniref:DUF4349 domain-containing protein n=2 Tax=Couchioplanes caeruleus TaxID=56438 RepID=A0A1K0GJW7_9ACTN|nr:DUF4349 domain-containing protein [Couchioplanes caeruleus]OJF09483.1 hypothetical protein BG844_37370 [Couchioplanes caeruleus subsp. caeruleus]ROP31920.1 uncharacterized protein DUF4349 [Couchioplanes caeruleus]
MAGSSSIRPSHARHRLTSGLCAAGIAAALALAGCSGYSSSDSQSASSRGGDIAGPAPAEQGAAPPQAGAGPDQAGAAPPQGKDTAAQAPHLGVDQRSIVYTGSITVRVEDVGTAAARVTGIVTGAGGFVGGDKRSSSGKDEPSDATLTLRVPAAKFAAVVDQVAQLGEEEQRGIDTEDVTEQTVDLQARIATQQARVASGRKLLAQAKSLEDLVMLEREVATRESDLASLQAKQRRLADLTALSTITVVLLDPESSAKSDDEPSGFVAGLRKGWTGLLASLGVVATVLGWVLPWLLILGVPAWIGVHFVRRRRRLRPAVATAGPAETP